MPGPQPKDEGGAVVADGGAVDDAFADFAEGTDSGAGADLTGQSFLLTAPAGDSTATTSQDTAVGGITDTWSGDLVVPVTAANSSATTAEAAEVEQPTDDRSRPSRIEGFSIGELSILTRGLSDLPVAWMDIRTNIPMLRTYTRQEWSDFAEHRVGPKTEAAIRATEHIFSTPDRFSPPDRLKQYIREGARVQGDFVYLTAEQIHKINNAGMANSLVEELKPGDNEVKPERELKPMSDLIRRVDKMSPHNGEALPVGVYLSCEVVQKLQEELCENPQMIEQQERPTLEHRAARLGFNLGTLRQRGWSGVAVTLVGGFLISIAANARDWGIIKGIEGISSALFGPPAAGAQLDPGSSAGESDSQS